ncbi:MAG: class A beta-lactamase [Pyrinomonadaceae bacterium]
MKLYLILLLNLLLLSASCSYVQSDQIPAPSNISPTPTAVALLMPDAELQKQIEDIAKEAKGKVGVAAVVLETGENVSLNRNEHFPMQSIYKVPISMTVLKMVDDAKVRLGQQVDISPDDFVRWGFHSPIRNLNPAGTQMPVYEIMRYSTSESDGTATDVLLELVGGPAAVQAYLSDLGIENMIVSNTIKEISRDWETQYRNWATPDAAVELLRVFQEGRALSPDSTNLLRQFMTETDTGARRLKAGLPKEVFLAHKTGTGGTKDGITGATNDFGIITAPDGRHIAIAVFVSDSSADGPTREKVIADIAKAVWEKWSGEPAVQDVSKGKTDSYKLCLTHTLSRSVFLNNPTPPGLTANG